MILLVLPLPLFFKTNSADIVVSCEMINHNINHIDVHILVSDNIVSMIPITNNEIVTVISCSSL